jgi:hypothetical protein
MDFQVYLGRFAWISRIRGDFILSEVTNEKGCNTKQRNESKMWCDAFGRRDSHLIRRLSYIMSARRLCEPRHNLENKSKQINLFSYKYIPLDVIADTKFLSVHMDYIYCKLLKSVHYYLVYYVML